MQATKQTSFLSNDTLLMCVLSYSSARDLGRTACVSHQWKRCSDTDLVWKNLQLYKDPTPSPIKKYTVQCIKERCIAILRKVNTVPESLPSYNSPIVTSGCSIAQTWKNFVQFEHYQSFMLEDFSHIDDCVKVTKLMSLIAGAIDQCIRFDRIGFTNLCQAENLAIKTMSTFHNPEPFYILETAYKKKGSILKANEMKKLAELLT